MNNSRHQTLSALTIGLLLPLAIRGLNYEPDLLNPYVSSNFQVEATQEVAGVKNQAVRVRVGQTKPKTRAISESINEPITKYSEIEAYILEVFGESEGMRGVKMLKECENKNMNERAINTANSNGSVDRGLWQINSIHGHNVDKLMGHKFNTNKAYQIYKNAGNSFRPWTCSYILGVKSFWQ